MVNKTKEKRMNEKENRGGALDDLGYKSINWIKIEGTQKFLSLGTRGKVWIEHSWNWQASWLFHSKKRQTIKQFLKSDEVF